MLPVLMGASAALRSPDSLIDGVRQISPEKYSEQLVH